jgi:hypothetical protein
MAGGDFRAGGLAEFMGIFASHLFLPELVRAEEVALAVRLGGIRGGAGDE